jgi:hypothetical protein
MSSVNKNKSIYYSMFFGFGNTKKNKHTQYKTKKMNCSPMVKGRTVTSDTCFTSKSLNLLKEAYNKNHPEAKILYNDAKQILGGLKDKITNCTTEDCWLQLLPDKEKRYLDEYIFAPDQPHDWTANPNEWLSNVDIFAVLKQYMKAYKNYVIIGPTPIDFNKRPKDNNGKCVWQDLCDFSLESYIKRGITKIGIVFNLDEHNEPGSHWTSMFIDIKHKFIFYFDSAANTTPPEITALKTKIIKQGKLLGKSMKFKYYQNYPHEHQKTNTECGMYSLFFNITMLMGQISDGTKLRDMGFKSRINLFKKGKISDKYVEALRNVYFNRT